jgi:hypothetical protein
MFTHMMLDAADRFELTPVTLQVENFICNMEVENFEFGNSSTVMKY